MGALERSAVLFSARTDDELVVRAGAEQNSAALKSAHARPMDFTGRPMTGMVYVSPAGVSRGPALQRWVTMGLAGADSAAPSKRKKKTT